MERTTKKIIGWSAFGLGAGAVVYAADKLGWLKSIIPGGGTPSQYVLSPTASFQPGLTTPYPLGVTAATITWQNPSANTVTYGVQGYIVANGNVDGHWWSSLTAAEQALAASRKGGATALAPYVSNVALRVAAVQVAAGQQGSVKLFAQLATPETEQWIFLVKPNYTGGLVATDPQGSNASSTAPAGVPGLTATVKVG
jgi:hypothetical protein